MDPNVITTPVQPSPPPVEAVPPIPNNNRKKLVIVVVAIFIIFMLLIVGVIVMSRMKKNDKQVPPVLTATLTPTQIIQPTSLPELYEVLILKKGEVTKVPNTDVTLTFSGISSPESGCYDCISATEVLIEKGEDRKTLEYSCGGITGDCINDQESFGYSVKLEKTIDDNTLQVIVSSK